MRVKVSGDCLYPDWIGAFFIPLIQRTSSIVILPNYRLTPEHTGAEILSDLSDFWTWFNAHSPSTYLTPKHADLYLDYSKVLVTGDSAGGYMALMSALLHRSPGIKAVLAQYPMTNYLRKEKTGTMFGQPVPPESTVEKHVSAIKPGGVISSAIPPARSDLSYALAAYGKYLTYFGEGAKLWPIGLIAGAGTMPPTWIIHGEADSAVEIGDSLKFVEEWTANEVRGEVKLSVVPGMEHGFDDGMKEDEEEWLREGLEWVEGKWLG